MMQPLPGSPAYRDWLVSTRQHMADVLARANDVMLKLPEGDKARTPEIEAALTDLVQKLNSITDADWGIEQH